MGKLFKSILLSLFVFLSFAQTALAEGQRVLIFYSSIGMGHLSAAKAIEANLRLEDPSVEVKLVNIRDTIASERRAKFDEWLFWKVVKGFPNVYDYLFNKKMEAGNRSRQLPLNTPYEADSVLKIVDDFKPSHIVTTHYGSTVALIGLREQHKLGNIPVAWLHTDYFQGYFPRISKNIEMTFLGADALTKIWTEEGLSKDRVATTGIPINPKAFETVDRDTVLVNNGLDPKKKTIVLMSGGEGVGDFPLIVKSITDKVKEPVQIVAICGKNEGHVKKLNALQGKLPGNVTLQVHGFVSDNNKVLDLIKSSDVYITKSGGLSPTEGFAINKPMVLLDVYGGHERKNAELLESLGMALVNKDQSKIGADVSTLLTDKKLVDGMLKAQKEFRNSFNLAAINRFIFNNSGAKLPEPVIDFGLENGPKVEFAEEAINRMNQDFKSDIEIILSYGKSDSNSLYKGDTNPFGHLAIKIDGEVYTLNGQAKLGEEHNLVWKTPLVEYLYGVVRETKNMEHSDAFGNSYARDNIALRIKGVDAAAKAKMLAFVDQINEKYRAGEVKYVRNTFNCADLVKQILEAANLVPARVAKPRTLPLDVLTDYKEYFEGQSQYETEMSIYNRAIASKNMFQQITFPLSIYQLKRGITQIIFPKRLDPFEKEVKSRIYLSANRGAYYETTKPKKAQAITSANASNKLSCAAFYAH